MSRKLLAVLFLSIGLSAFSCGDDKKTSRTEDAGFLLSADERTKIYDTCLSKVESNSLLNKSYCSCKANSLAKKYTDTAFLSLVKDDSAYKKELTDVSATCRNEAKSKGVGRRV
ncbi:MAG: hypothetical protein KBD78_03220 [Oligoflexales bacterium]|nr:hypothetical protein [Oligoflexales bacterium]